jgi:hypothetical protein
LSLHPAIADAIFWVGVRAGETFKQAKPICSPTGRCPAVYHPQHAAGDASHLVELSDLGVRIAELAGLFGEDLSALSGATAKAAHAVKTLPPSTFGATPPFDGLSFVALRGGSTHEIHLHRGGDRIVESRVSGRVWKSLPHELAPGTGYTVFKRRYSEASLHRQWGREEAIQWAVGLANFYRDRTGLRLGIGDVSHVVGGKMTDHGSHQEGRDMDVYVLDYPAGTTYPDAFWCDGASTTTLILSRLVPPTGSTDEIYETTGMTRLGTAEESATFERYATVIAYCWATWARVNTVTWHGVQQVEGRALVIAQEAFDAGWQDTWGAAPARREDIGANWKSRRVKLVGQGSSNYGPGKGWPPHHDHLHIRLDV